MKAPDYFVILYGVSCRISKFYRIIRHVRVPKFCNRYMGHTVEISKFYLSGECYKNHIRHVRMQKFCNWHMGHAVEISKFYLSGECYIFLHAYLSYSLTRVTKNRWRKKTDIPYGMSYAYNIRPRLHTGSIFFVICIALRLKFRKWRHFWSSSSLNKYRVRGCDVKKNSKYFETAGRLGLKAQLPGCFEIFWIFL